MQRLLLGMCADVCDNCLAHARLAETTLLRYAITGLDSFKGTLEDYVRLPGNSRVGDAHAVVVAIHGIRCALLSLDWRVRTCHVHEDLRAPGVGPMGRAVCAPADHLA